MRSPSCRLAGIALAALALTAGCAARDADTELLVSTAISLAPALEELGADYQAAHPGTAIRLNAGASGILVQQMRRGAPVDLFVSASMDEMRRLADDGRIDATDVVVLASNRLVWVTPAGFQPAAAPWPADFDSIALGNPRTSPLGRYTSQALASLGAGASLTNRAVWGENARQVVEYVARGEVAAGIVYRSDALLLGDRVERGAMLDPASHEPIVYCAAVPDDAPRPEQAREFLRHLRSPAGARVLARHGFAEPGE